MGTRYSLDYGTSSAAASSSSFDVIILIMLFLIGIAAFCAWLLSISLFVKEARRKGHFKTAALWFIGLFATPIVVGIYTAQLPNIRNDSNKSISMGRDFSMESNSDKTELEKVI